MGLDNVQRVVIVVEGGIVRNVMTDDQALELRLVVLDHDVEEFTGHKFEGRDVNFYEEDLQAAPEEVQRIFDEAGPMHGPREGDFLEPGYPGKPIDRQFKDEG